MKKTFELNFRGRKIIVEHGESRKTVLMFEAGSQIRMI